MDDQVAFVCFQVNSSVLCSPYSEYRNDKVVYTQVSCSYRRSIYPSFIPPPRCSQPGLKSPCCSHHVTLLSAQQKRGRATVERASVESRSRNSVVDSGTTAPPPPAPAPYSTTLTHTHPHTHTRLVRS
jgi:hypothetical protein